MVTTVIMMLMVIMMMMLALTEAPVLDQLITMIPKSNYKIKNVKKLLLMMMIMMIVALTIIETSFHKISPCGS